MSAPRRILPGCTYMVTRRTVQRMFLLKPVPLVNQVFMYCLAHAAKKYDIQVHAFCMMSNHYHIVLTDTCARLPAFMSYFNEFVAKALNCMHGRWEHFWSQGTYSMVRLGRYEDVLEKSVYCLVNPVKAGLVASVEQWPGPNAYRVPVRGRVEVKRPGLFFRKEGPMPDKAELVLFAPPGFGEGEGEVKKWLLKLRRATREREAEIRAERKEAGLSFLGARAVLDMSPEDVPGTREPRRGLDPQVASRDPEVLEEMVRELKAFRDSYRRAFKHWREGELFVEFPNGTYALREVVQVHPHLPP